MKSHGISRRSAARFAKAAAASLLAFTFVFAYGCSSAEDTPDDGSGGADSSPIKSVKTLGFVDMDAVKLKAVVLEYDEDLTGATVSTSTFSVTTYDPKKYDYIGDGKIGDVINAYVNATPEIDDGGTGTGTGHYVILEMFTDFLATAELQYTSTLIARVTQKEDIVCGDGTVIGASTTAVSNLVDNKMTGDSFDIIGLEGFRWYTNDPGNFGADGPAFHWDNCFNQQDGLYYDEDLAYALYLPDDWHEGGNYAMVTLQNPAANQGTHPLVTVVTTRSPSVYASDWAQELVKEKHGVDGLIVLVPVVTERVNDNGGTPAEYEALVHLWDYIIEEYSVNPDYVYGSGQSVGGMVLLETQRNRDNFFAGLLLYEDQWAQNYYVDTIFERDMMANSSVADTASMHYPRTDSYITYDYYLDTDGNPVYEDYDPYNYYFQISDDNILIMNRGDNNLCIDTWTELKYLYQDLTGYELESVTVNASDSLETQNEQVRAYFDRENALNINWVIIASGSNGYSCRKIDASYEWLLSQSRQTEIAREKLPLNAPFELADEQIQDESRELYFTGPNGETLYFLTGKAGAGTQLYNTCWLNLAYVADAAPGWLPEGMSWNSGVAAAHVEDVIAISDTAIAIKYDTDMSGLVINLKGEKVYNHITGEYRDNDLIVLDPFLFYGTTDSANDTLLDFSIKNVYVNSLPETVSGAALKSGEGCYIIVEFDGAVSGITGVLQRTTIRTASVIANASYKIYNVAG